MIDLDFCSCDFIKSSKHDIHSRWWHEFADRFLFCKRTWRAIPSLKISSAILHLSHNFNWIARNARRQIRQIKYLIWYFTVVVGHERTVLMSKFNDFNETKNLFIWHLRSSSPSVCFAIEVHPGFRCALNVCLFLLEILNWRIRSLVSLYGDRLILSFDVAR